MILKFIIACLLFSLLTLNVLGQVSGKQISLNYKHEPLRVVLNGISKLSGAEFVYRDEVVKDVFITCNSRGETSERVLNKIMDQANIEYKKYGTVSYILLGKREPRINKVRTLVLEDKPEVTDTIYSISKPILISKNELVYPPEAVKKKISGKLRLKLYINSAGDVIQSLVESSSGSSMLDSASLDYSRDLKFAPAKSKGKDRGVWITMKFEFHILENQ
jgi:TonB family protein